MKFTYYAQSSFLLEAEGKRILFDPFIQSSGKLPGFNSDGVQADLIAVSHGHYDHVADLEYYAKQGDATVLCIYEIMDWLKKKSVTRVHPMNIGGTYQSGNIRIKMVSAVHSSTLPDGTPGGIAAGFIIEAEGKRIYYAGDTALHADMELIGKYQTPDLLILPVGGNFTMDYHDAARACELTRCSRVIGVHFDTHEMIRINHAEATNYFTTKQLTLILPTHGQTIDLF